jgi:hypothetical protein
MFSDDLIVKLRTAGDPLHILASDALIAKSIEIESDTQIVVKRHTYTASPSPHTSGWTNSGYVNWLLRVIRLNH